jgi:DNA-binding transcriptional ArsR family regulator
VTEVFAVLAEPRRRQILDLVLDREHLKVLRAAGLVEVRVDEQRRLYRLTPAPLRDLDAWLARYRLAWGGSLDDLGRHLDEMAADEAAAVVTTTGETG